MEIDKISNKLNENNILEIFIYMKDKENNSWWELTFKS